MRGAFSPPMTRPASGAVAPGWLTKKRSTRMSSRGSVTTKSDSSNVTDALPTDLVDQALSVGEGLTGTDLGGIADAVGQGQGVQDIAVDAASGAVEGTAAEPIVTALGDAQS